MDDIKNSLNKYSRFFVELKRRVIIVLLLFVTAMFAGFFFYEPIIKFLIGTLSLEGVNIVFTSPFQFINLALACGVATGVVVSLPLIIIQLLSFLKPALKNKEFRMILGALPYSLLLFALGFIFGTLIMKWQIEIFLARSISLGIGNILDISKLLSVVILTSVFMGLGFQFPILLLILLKLGVVSLDSLKGIRKWVYVASLIFAIVLPPDSILADILLSLPLIVLFELTIIIYKISRK